MLQIAKRASLDRELNPGPEISTALSAATVLRLRSPRMWRITSLPPIPRGGLPTSTIDRTSGICGEYLVGRARVERLLCLPEERYDP